MHLKGLSGNHYSLATLQGRAKLHGLHPTNVLSATPLKLSSRWASTRSSANTKSSDPKSDSDEESEKETEDDNNGNVLLVFTALLAVSITTLVTVR